MFLKRFAPIWFALLFSVTLLLALPTLTVWGAWLGWDSSQSTLLAHLWGTVLPRYTLTSLWLGLGVAVGVSALGFGSALLVTLFDFPGRATLTWALLLPVAMPAYVVAYAYTDFFQFSGPVQTTLRAWTGWQGAVLPDIRSVGGAMLVLSVTLYPYAYLLVRAALIERASGPLEAAKLLGAGLGRRVWSVAIPMVRPALAAGLALALMETLADFGVASYFGVQTFTTGIYKAWLVMDDASAAAQLSSVLLLFVLALLAWEHKAQRRIKFGSTRVDRGGREAQPLALRGAPAWFCLGLGLIPVTLGFGLPTLILGHLWLTSAEATPWGEYAGWSLNTLKLGGITAVLAVAIAMAFLVTERVRRHPLVGLLTRLIGVGYAIPGVVVVIGILVPLRWFQEVEWVGALSYWVTATGLGIVWAYLIRFCAVALQSIGSGYSRLPLSMDEASRMLGVSGLPMVRRVHMPLMRNTLFIAGLLVLVDVMKELPATLVLRPFDSDTLAVVAYQLARDERLAEAAVPSLTLVLIGLIPVIWVSRSLRQVGR